VCLSTGVDYAITAEAADDVAKAEVWLDRAVHCFKQVHDVDLQRKARTHRLGARFRVELEGFDGNHEDATRMELKAADVLKSLIEDGLSTEARKVCDSLMPILDDYSLEQIERRILSLIADED
jgi:hypothetical protein